LFYEDYKSRGYQRTQYACIATILFGVFLYITCPIIKAKMEERRKKKIDGLKLVGGEESNSEIDS